ncbi:MAG: succinylglutamate desuccinylase/aspartoacylase family protein [Bacillota bacterium]
MKKESFDAFVSHQLEVYTFGQGQPRMLVTAGLHGGEATGIYVANQLVEFLKDKPVQGEIKILTCANPTAFQRLQRASPFDELDLNRIFPGDSRGTVSQRTADFIWNLAKEMDYIVDLHCCGSFSQSYTLALYEEFEYARKLAELLAVPVVIESGGTRGQLFVEACHRGIPAVIIELTGGGQGGIVDLPAAEMAILAMQGLFMRLGLMEGEPVPAEPKFYGKLTPVRSTEDGFYAPAVQPGEVVSQGQTVGTVDGRPVVAPFNGIAMMVRPHSYIFAGHPAVVLAPGPR